MGCGSAFGPLERTAYGSKTVDSPLLIISWMGAQSCCSMAGAVPMNVSLSQCRGSVASTMSTDGLPFRRESSRHHKIHR